MVALSVAINLLPVFFTTLQRNLGGEAGLTDEQLGRIGAVTFAGLVLAIMITGPLADRLGVKVFALGSSAFMTVGLLLLGLSRSYNSILLSVFIMGLGTGTLDMVLSPIVAAYYPHRRTAAMNALHSFYCTGAVLTVLIAAGSLKLSIDWHIITLWSAAMPLAVLIGFAFTHLPALVDESAGQSRQRVRDLIKTRYFIAALFAIALGGAAEMGLVEWMPAYAEKALGYSAFTGAMAFTGFLMAMAAGRITIGMMGHRAEPVKILLVCCAASTLLFIIACAAPAPLALAGCVAAGFAGSALWPSMLAVAADRFPRGGASMYGILSAFGNVGGIAMPWLVGFMTDHWRHSMGYAPAMRWGLATAVLCPLFMGLILWTLRKRQPALRVQRWLLLRHGQTDDNINGICQGQRPVDINETGRRQAHQLGAALQAEGAKVDRIVASDLPRAATTARIIAEYVHAPVEFEPGLRERALGAKEGTHVGIEGIWLAAMGTDTPPGGEAMDAFKTRVRDALNNLPGKEASASRIALVFHGGPLRTILQMLHDGVLQMAPGEPRPEVVNIVNCSIMELESQTRDGAVPTWRVIRVNDTRHLAADTKVTSL